MTKLNNGFEGSESRFAGVVKGVVVCLLMAGAVLVGSGMQRRRDRRRRKRAGRDQ
jgi:hypothetical protein